VILRHAKAANPEGVADIERPLSSRGQADATAAGEWLSHQPYQPDLVLCSPSRRTRGTWHGVALGLRRAPEVEYVDNLYNGTAEDLLQAVMEVEPDTGTVLLVGHNPGVSQLSALLDPDGADPEDLATAGLAIHTSEAAWADWGTRTARLTTSHTARGQKD
jgi:phosphohistidine phosphatase